MQNVEELTVDQLGNRETIRANSFNSEQIVKISLDKITIREGFNVRQDYGDIKSLAASLSQNGQSLPGRVDILANGDFVLTDGHRRYRALQSLAEETGEEMFFMAVVNKTKTTEEERILQMFTTQDNKPLAPVEIAELIQRLVNFGHDKKSIAKKIGKSTGYVENMLTFASEAPAIKAHVSNGKMKVTTALSLRKSTPNTTERIEKANKAVESSNGKTKNVSKALKETGVVGVGMVPSNLTEAKARKIAKAILKDEKMQTEERLVEIILPML